MAKYRKTALIEAVQFIPGASDDIPGIEWDLAMMPFIRTLEGRPMRVSPGDWIATGIKGEHWAIKPDVFALSYEIA